MDSSRHIKKTEHGEAPALSKHLIRLERKGVMPVPEPSTRAKAKLKKKEEKSRTSFFTELLKTREPAEAYPGTTQREALPEHHSIPDVEIPAPRGGALRPRRRRKALLALVTGLVAIGAFMGVLSTVMARMTIMVKPRVETVDLAEVALVFDASVAKPDNAAHRIPAEFFEFTASVSDEFETTGQGSGATKSSGNVRIYNAYSASPQVLVATTRFVTKEGILFRLPQAVIVPAATMENGKLVAQFIEADLVADKAGTDGNIAGQATLRIPGFKDSAKYDGFYATTVSGFSGGGSGSGRAVSADDVKHAQEQLSKKVFDTLKADLARKIPPEFKLVDGLREIEVTSVDVPRERTPGEKFTGTAKAVARVVVFRESDISGILSDSAVKNAAPGELLPNMSDVHYQLRDLDFEKKRADVTVRGAVKAVRKFSERDIAVSLAGKKEADLIETLRTHKEFATFRIAFFPPWLYRAPADPKKIKFVVEKAE